MPVIEIQPAVDMVVGRRGRKILLTGTCWYELTGLWHLLSAQGYNVYRVPQGYSSVRKDWDLVIVALSTEPVAGWGRNLPRIRELRAEMSGEMLVLVPERLEMLKVLRNICPVYSGCMPLLYLERTVRMALNRKTARTGKFRLTSGQRQALKRLSERGIFMYFFIFKTKRIYFLY